LDTKKFLFSTSFSRLVYFHIVLGALCVISNIFIILWVWLVLYQVVTRKDNSIVGKISIISYLVGLEILCRMSKTSPFIPYEFGKYLLIIAPLILSRVRIEKIVSLILLLPGIILGIVNGTEFLLFVFNIFGWIAFVLFRMMTDRVEISQNQLNRLLLLTMAGSLGAVFLAFFKTPDVSDVQFSYDANFTTSGGFAPNQVATSFGLGIGVIGYFIITKLRQLPLWVLLSFLAFYIYRGILTFSRGGIIIGLFVILSIFVLNTFYQGRNLFRNVFILAFLAITIIVGATVVNEISDGFLYKRLTGETLGTEYGVKEKDINTLTSGRVDIFRKDLDLFYEYFPLGTGVHVSTVLRAQNSISEMLVASHVELSRLLSEHGVLGILFLLLVLYWFRTSFSRQPTITGKYFVALCFVFSIGTTFHSATRTFITPLMGGLAMLKVVEERKREMTTKGYN
jgi:hypothetical protein